MRRGLVFLVLAAGAVAAFVLTRDAGAPFPTARHVRAHGLAAWPADTVEEAKSECDGAPSWRSDAYETAVRFTEDVMGYPDAGGEDFTGEGASTTARFLMNTKGVGGVFLGSLIELKQFGDCWYVVDGEPREGSWTEATTFGFVHRNGQPHVLLGNVEGVPAVHVGFGGWETEVEPGDRQTVVPMDGVAADATGHVVYLDPDENGVSETVGIETLGAIPRPPSGSAVTPLGHEGDDDGCAAPAAKRLARRLFGGSSVDLLRHPVTYPPTTTHLRGDRWRVRIDGVELTAVVDCGRLVSLAPVDRDPPLRRLWLDDRGATVGIDWGGGDDAYVHVGDLRSSAGGVLKELGERVTFPWSNGAPASPVPAFVVLYNDGRIVSASYGLYSVPGSS
jgi:hypothetical protein